MSEGDQQTSASRTEQEALVAVLERNRRTFAWKVWDLDEQGLRATTAASFPQGRAKAGR